MAKKDKRLNKDAFNWVQDTSKESGEEETGKKGKESKSQSAPAEKKSKTARQIFVRYNKDSGDIAAIQEVSESVRADIEKPWSDVPEEQEVDTFKLTGDLRGMRLLDIHTSYRVDRGGKKPKLVPVK